MFMVCKKKKTSLRKPYGCFVGPGSFFRSHVDTPKSGKMFGSLVVALPTKHEGGTFPLRHNGREWVFNSADLVSPQNTESPRAAFVAFFGDIGHEVTEVKSGYRVTLTYNLYFGDDNSATGIVPSPPTMLPIDDTEMKIKKSLRALLNNPKFLPDGGLVGFDYLIYIPLPVVPSKTLICTNLVKISKARILQSNARVILCPSMFPSKRSITAKLTRFLAS